MNLERRFVTFECKADAAEEGVFEGYGSVFGVLDSYDDEVMPGAFTESLERHAREGTWPDMLFSHMVTEPVGEWLDLREDDLGLRTKGRLWIGQDGKAPDQYALKSYRAMQRKKGKLGLSIGFETKGHHMKGDVRRITKADLWEISPVVFPANGAARVMSVRSAELPSERTLELALRDVGLSRAEAKRVVSSCFKSLLRDAGDFTQPSDIAGRHVEGNHEVLDALRAHLGSATTWTQKSRA